MKIPHIQIMSYMGNKRALLEDIIPIILENSTQNKAVLDLFAGTSSIGYALKNQRVVFSNDIQSYSKIISEALMKNYSNFDITSLINKLEEDYNKNKNALSELFKIPLEIESNLLDNNYLQNMDKYKEFIKDYPFVGGTQTGFGLDTLFEVELTKRKENPKLFPYMLFSLYYSNGYYSVRQSIEIDSLKYAIDNVEEVYKPLCLISLLYVMGITVSSTGHYAQYRNINSLSSYKSIAKLRLEEIYPKFAEKLINLKSEIIDNSQVVSNVGFNPQSFQDNYLNILNNEEIMSKVGHVYADPPYTAANYSRFYHVPETLVLYDYPDLSINSKTNKVTDGRYRNDRFSSPFCKIKEVTTSFEEMVKNTAKWNIPMTISYSNNSLLTIDFLVPLMNKYYNSVEIKEFPYSHSKQGRDEILKINECLFILKNPKTENLI